MRTKEETIEYFKELSRRYAVKAHRNKDFESKGKSEAYELAAFEIERNMKPYIFTKDMDLMILKKLYFGKNLSDIELERASKLLYLLNICLNKRGKENGNKKYN